MEYFGRVFLLCRTFQKTGRLVAVIHVPISTMVLCESWGQQQEDGREYICRTKLKSQPLQPNTRFPRWDSQPGSVGGKEQLSVYIKSFNWQNQSSLETLQTDNTQPEHLTSRVLWKLRGCRKALTPTDPRPELTFKKQDIRNSRFWSHCGCTPGLGSGSRASSLWGRGQPSPWTPSCWMSWACRRWSWLFPAGKPARQARPGAAGGSSGAHQAGPAALQHGTNRCAWGDWSGMCWGYKWSQQGRPGCLTRQHPRWSHEGRRGNRPGAQRSPELAVPGRPVELQPTATAVRWVDHKGRWSADHVACCCEQRSARRWDAGWSSLGSLDCHSSPLDPSSALQPFSQGAPGVLTPAQTERESQLTS